MGAWLVRCVIGVALLCLGGTMAFGQLESREAATPWRLSLRVGGEYTDNRDGSATNKQSNWDGIVEPRMSYLYRDADRTSVQLTLMPMVKWHSNPRTAAEGGGQDDTDFFGSGGVEVMHRATPKVTLTAGDQVTYNDDPQIVDSGIRVRRTASYVMNDVHATVDAALTAKAGVGLETMAVSTRYEDDIMARETDSDLYSAEVTPRYLVGSGWTVIGLVGMSRFEVEGPEPSRAADTVTCDAGFEKSYGPNCVGTVLGGYQGVQYANPDLESAHRMNGSAELELGGMTPTRYRLAAEYGYEPPGLSSHAVQAATTFSGAVDHDVLADRLTISLEGRYRDSSYEGEGPEAPEGSEQMTRIGLRGTYYLTRKWSITGGYAFEKWESELSESFQQNLVDVSVIAEL